MNTALYLYDTITNKYIKTITTTSVELHSDFSEVTAYGYKSSLYDVLIGNTAAYAGLAPEIHQITFKYVKGRKTVHELTKIPVKNFSHFPFLLKIREAITYRKQGINSSWYAKYAAAEIARQMATKSRFFKMTHVIILPPGTTTQFEFLKGCGFKQRQFYITQADRQYYIFISDDTQMSMAKLGLDAEEIISLV